jgi:Ca2+/Na+ antiporter
MKDYHNRFVFSMGIHRRGARSGEEDRSQDLDRTATSSSSRQSPAFSPTSRKLCIAFDDFRHKRRTPPASEERSPHDSPDEPSRRLGRTVFFFILGLALVVVGSRLPIGSAIKMAQYLSVPPVLIGLTLVALGTSLPELVTALTSFRKGVADISLGDIVGAGVLNCTVIIGAAAVIRPLTMTRVTQLYNMPALLITVIALRILAKAGSDLNRRDGLILLCLYGAYVVGLVLLEQA